MWILHLLPDTLLELVINIVLAIGVVGSCLGFILKYIPFLIQYRIPLNIISTIFLVSGIYFKGGYGVELEWRARVEELQKKVDVAEAKSAVETVRIETQVVERVKYIKEKTHANKQTIQQNAEIINADCRIPDIARVLYNRAVSNEVSRSPKSLTGASTEVNSVKAGTK